MNLQPRLLCRPEDRDGVAVRRVHPVGGLAGAKRGPRDRHLAGEDAQAKAAEDEEALRMSAT